MCRKCVEFMASMSPRTNPGQWELYISQNCMVCKSLLCLQTVSIWCRDGEGLLHKRTVMWVKTNRCYFDSLTGPLSCY